MIIEACVESLGEALIAEGRGADRIELCANLAADGLTPSLDLISSVKRQVSIPIKVMIRPRSGNFVYNSSEFREMISAIEFCKSEQVSGVVFGILDDSDMLNIEMITRLVKVATPLEITIHKAIDLTPDPVRSVALLSMISGIHSILSSGSAVTAEMGIPILKDMIDVAGGNIEIVVAGKVTQENIMALHSKLRAKAYHGRKIVGDLTQGTS